MRLGDYLVEEGYISPSQLKFSLQESKRRARLLGEVVVELGYVSESIVAGFLASHAEAGFIDFSQVDIDVSALDAVPYAMALKFKLLPLNITDKEITIAMADIYNVVAIDAVEKACGLAVHAVAAAETELLEVLMLYYAQEATIEDTIKEVMRQVDLEDNGEQSDSPLAALVNQILMLGIRSQATDIHIEPEENALRIRMRRDGVMHEEVIIPSRIKAAIIARVKIMADMDITEKRIPQDGRIRFMLGRKKVDLRVSSLPTQHGESIVMRILDTSHGPASLDDLGFSPKALARFKKALATPYGIILVTGPTGSGKTTTLYASLGEIDTEQRSVFTLEDPVEYAMSGVRQTQIREDIGMSFAKGLRALLRQDPDVILLGEIRDNETAALAVRAALTGHTVFSTLHTNDAVSAIPRLLDMDIEPYLLPSALVAVVAQRLVRKLCPSCKKEVPNVEEILAQFGLAETPEDVHLWKAVGCDACKQSGYIGRQAIYEVLLMDDAFHEPIMHGAGRKDMLKLAKAKGMKLMLEDALLKAIQGITSIEEIMRVMK